MRSRPAANQAAPIEELVVSAHVSGPSGPHLTAEDDYPRYRWVIIGQLVDADVPHYLSGVCGSIWPGPGCTFCSRTWTVDGAVGHIGD